MLPVSTTPNAIVFAASGIKTMDMLKAKAAIAKVVALNLFAPIFV